MVAEIGMSEFLLVVTLLCLVVVPIAAIAFFRSGKAYENLGKGAWSIDREEPAEPGAAPPPEDPAEREAEVRQMVEAAAYRRRQRGEGHPDVETETARLLGIDPDSEDHLAKSGSDDDEPEDEEPGREPDAPEPDRPGAGEAAAIREEIRQLVVANNERRVRRGDPPLQVEPEVERRLRDWT